MVGLNKIAEIKFDDMRFKYLCLSRCVHEYSCASCTCIRRMPVCVPGMVILFMGSTTSMRRIKSLDDWDK